MANWGGLPSIVSALPNDLRNFLQRVKETLDGAMTGNSRFVTVNDLVNGNVATIDQYGNVTNGNLSFDYTPPPAPTNLTATGALTTIMLQWDDPLYANLAHAEIWRASVNNQGLSVLIGTSSGVLYADSVDAGSTYYYWARFISKANVPGAFNAISGVHGTTSSNPAGLLEILTGEITSSQLHAALGNRINLIDAPTTGLIAQVGALNTLTIPAITAQANIDVSQLAFAINELSLQASAAQQKLLFSKAITDATITVDPVAGTITLNAVEALKNGSDITLNTVETTLSAHDASIISNANTISSVGGRITSAESTIAQHSSDILLRATKTELNDVAAAILAGFTPAYTWAFNGTTESWTTNAATLTAFSYDMEVAETGAGAYITSPAISVVGATYALIYLKLDKKAGTGWTGKVQYQTAAHGYSDSHHKIFAQPTWDATYKVLALDMTTLTAGGGDWEASTITGIRIFLGAGSGDTTDIDTIEIGKSQIDQILTADINARLGSAEVSIDANTAAIALKASQITVSGHDVRLTTAEADIDASAAAIALKAASTTVTAIDARLGTAEVDIDANTASINSKASIVTVDALDTRVSTAESNIDANAGSISLVTSQSQEATSNVNAVGDSLLSALLGLDNTLGRDRASSYGVAMAMLEISSAVDAFGAEAAARLLLEAAYQSTAAALSNDYYTKAAADAAVASYTSSMSAAAFKQRIYRQPAAPTSVTLFIGDAWIDTANNQRISYWDGTAWQLSQDTRIAANAAAITLEQEARANGDSANASSISTLSSQVNHATTGLPAAHSAVQTEATTRASADSANASSISQVQARLDTGDYAAVKTESSANASAITGLSVEYSLKLDVNGFISGYGTVNDGTSSEFLIATNTFGIVAPTLNSDTEPVTKYHGLIWKNTSAGTVAGVPAEESRRWVVVSAVGSWQLVGFGALPFAVLTTATTINGTEFQPGVYIDGASIVEATIGNAQIGNAAVDDARIANISANKVTFGEMSGDRIAANSLSADRIMAGTLLAGSWIKVQGPTSNYGTTIHADGYIETEGALDKTRMTDGNVITYRKVGGVDYPYQSLSRVETGVAVNDTTVTIPGYFPTQPKVLVSPAALTLYKTAYANQDQLVRCEVLNLQETSAGSMQWQFTPRAQLELAANTGMTVLNATYGPISTDDPYVSAAQTTAANCTDMTVNVSFLSVRGNGASQYYRRKVSWRVGYRASGSGGAYTYTTSQVKDIGEITSGTVTDNKVVTFPSAGAWQFVVEYTASDVTPQVLFGSVTYDYTSDTRSSTGEVTNIVNGVGGNSTTISLGTYTPPSGYSVYSVDYSFQYAYYVYTYGYDFVNGYAVVQNNGVYKAVSVSWQSPAAQSDGSVALNNYTTKTFNAASYSSSISLSNSVSGAGIAKSGLKNATATIYSRRPTQNTTTPSNTYKLDSYSFNLSSAQVLAAGTLNWMAIGA